MYFTADCFIPLPCGIIPLIPENSDGRNRPDQSLVSCHKHTYSLPALSRIGSTAYMLMITLSTDFCNPISQDSYDNLIAGIQFHQLPCTCGHSGCLKIHGYYTRGLKYENAILRLCICRVRCSVCGRTHSLIPSYLVPYSQISLPDQAEIISSVEFGTSATAVMARTPSIDENNVSCILRRYRRYWRQRLLSESIPITPLPLLVCRCFDAFQRQFLQIKCTPNLLFLKTT